MSEQKIAAGTHVVKIIKWGLRETNSGGAQVWVKFSNGAVYFQTLINSDESKKYLAESLYLCGFKGKNLSKILTDDALDKKMNVEIFIKYKPHQETGVPQMNVYLNNPNKSIKGDMEKDSAMSKLKELAIDLSGALVDAKNEIGELSVIEDRESPVPDTKMEEPKAEFDSDSIPF